MRGLASIEPKSVAFGSDDTRFLLKSDRDVAQLIDTSCGLYEPSRKSNTDIVIGGIDMRAEIAYVLYHLDGLFEVRPHMSTEPLSQVRGGSEKVALMWGNSGPHIEEVLVGDVKSFDKESESARPLRENEDVVGENARARAHVPHNEGPWPHDDSEEHHAEGASLWDASWSEVRFSEVSSYVIVELEVLILANVSVKDGP